MNVKDNRSFWVYLLLSIVTCGLYSIYFWYVYVEDLNTVFYGDGEDSPNYIIVLLLSWQQISDEKRKGKREHQLYRISLYHRCCHKKRLPCLICT